MSIRLLWQLVWPKIKTGTMTSRTHLAQDQGCPTFWGGKGQQPLLWAESRAARVKFTISGTPKRLNYCAVFYSTIYKMWPRAAGWNPCTFERTFMTTGSDVAEY